FAKNPAGAFKVAGPRVGQRHRARRALEQTRAQPLFESGDQARDGGWGETEAACRGREPRQVGDGDEDGHGLETVDLIIATDATVKCQADALLRKMKDRIHPPRRPSLFGPAKGESPMS